MEEKMDVLKFLLFLAVTVHLSSAACFRHLQFHYTENTERETAEALLDGEQFAYYEKSKSKEIVIPKTEWMKKIENDDRRHWEDLTNKLKDGLRSARDFVDTAVSSSNRNEGDHTVQLMYGCKLRSGIESGYWKFSYDGKYFLSLNLNAGAWTPANDESEPIKQKMEKEGNVQKAFLEDECILWLKTYKSYKDPLSRRRRSAEENACPSQGFTATHSLQFFYTAVTPGIDFPEFTAVGLVDKEPMNYYDSDMKKVIPKASWMNKVDAGDPEYYKTQTQIIQGTQETFKVGVQTLMQRFNQSEGVHTVQLMYGCELDDGTKRGYFQYGYDGEDFISLDLNTGTWIAPTPQAVITKNKWDPDVANTNYWKNVYLLKECIEWLQKYVGYGRDTLERKVRPEVSVFQKDSSSPVVCHATGFFPKAVMITWQKNGEELNEDVELRETLPNQDGTFQKRSILTLSPEELHRNQYTCVIQHSSLEKNLVKPFQSDGGMGVIIGAVVAVLLIVLVAACVGVVVWKKKKSGFKSVPVYSNGSTDGENSSTNS